MEADERVPVPAAVVPPAPAPTAYVVAPVVISAEPLPEPEVGPASELALPEPAAAPEPARAPAPPRSKPSGPATSPGAAFNPEVVPADE